ncbi:MAG: hypothetical protein QOF48_2812 [Verrucomicrobiota bacterium]
MEADRGGDVVEFIPGNLMKLLSPRLKLLVYFNSLLRHRLVRGLRPAHEREVRTGGNALVTVRVETNAQEERFAAGF